jgi:hypothetical protein
MHQVYQQKAQQIAANSINNHAPQREAPPLILKLDLHATLIPKRTYWQLTLHQTPPFNKAGRYNVI